MVNVLPDLNERGEPRLPILARKKPEDTAKGCRTLEAGDRARAATMVNGHMRSTLVRSADAWALRADLLDRLEARFHARAQANVREHPKLRGMEVDDHG